jgi:hypothetical protein
VQCRCTWKIQHCVEICEDVDEYYPVATMRLFRTTIAPTRRFMQLDRKDASDANR